MNKTWSDWSFLTGNLGTLPAHIEISIRNKISHGVLVKLITGLTAGNAASGSLIKIRGFGIQIVNVNAAGAGCALVEVLAGEPIVKLPTLVCHAVLLVS
jgi:hypothetical protein